MSKITRLQRCLLLRENVQGRDFVVGDLHGHRKRFEKCLDGLRFDPTRDRVLSVGDLIDRGPQSLATLSLIEEPWFHAVLGNHEMLLLNHLGFYTSRRHPRKAYASGGGQWIVDALRFERKQVMRLAERLATLPLAIHVDGALPFNVVHGDLDPLGAAQTAQTALTAEPTLCVHLAERATTSRAHLARVVRQPLLPLSFDGDTPVQVSRQPVASLPLTYVGHSPMPQVTVHGSYVYIDQGVCRPCGPRQVPKSPTVLEHRRFAYWVQGVARAQSQGQSQAHAQAHSRAHPPAGAAAGPWTSKAASNGPANLAA